MTLDRDDLERTIALGDLDACIRTVDAICADRDWDAVLFFAERCRAACARGFQLWPAAEYARYRAALDAPAPIAAQTLVETAVALGLGSLAEVVASTHSWAELAPHVAVGPIAVLAMHERVVRGEDCSAITDGALPGPPVLEVPRALCEWEPAYPLAIYHSDRVDAPPPPRPAPDAFVPLASTNKTRGAVLDDVDSSVLCDALESLTRNWRSDPDTTTRAIAVNGEIAAAVHRLVGDVETSLRFAPISGRAALAHMSWIAANGGPLGRRRGMAVGRADAWHVAQLLGGAGIDEPLDAEWVAGALDELVWAWWDKRTPRGEWSVGLAIADPDAGQAWAFEVE